MLHIGVICDDNFNKNQELLLQSIPSTSLFMTMLLLALIATSKLQVV